MDSNSSPIKLDEPSELQETMVGTNEEIRRFINVENNQEEEFDTSLLEARKIDSMMDVNQNIELSLQTHNLPAYEEIVDSQFAVQSISEVNVNKLISYVFQKLCLQRGREKINSSRNGETSGQTTFRIDSDLIDILLGWTSNLI